MRVLLTFEVIVLRALVVPEAKVVPFLCVALDPESHLLDTEADCDHFLNAIRGARDNSIRDGSPKRQQINLLLYKSI